MEQVAGVVVVVVERIERCRTLNTYRHWFVESRHYASLAVNGGDVEVG